MCLLFLAELKFLNWRKNGLGKEYNDDELIFEGLFKNGERLRGKEYENDKVVFERVVL